jgi:hypothetical protein
MAVMTGRPRCRWEANIKTDFQETGLGGLDCVGRYMV